MKKVLLFVITVIACCQEIYAQNDPFITTWQVDANDQITIPLQSGTYNFNFEWHLVNDTVTLISGTHTNADGDFVTDFIFAGTYNLEITGQFPHLRGYPSDKLLDVNQWGSIVWRNMQSMFEGWDGVEFSAVDNPNLSQVESMNSIFRLATNFDGDVTGWNVSNVKNFFRAFQGATVFNQDIGGWNMSNATNLNATFELAKRFNQDISGWDVSKINSLNFTFSRTDDFNQDISGWDVSNVEVMRSTFEKALAFNQPIGEWDVRKVTQFRQILSGASSFNQSLGKWIINPNADFRESFTGTVGIDCENYSKTLIGLNFNNPDVQNRNFGGSNSFEYDSIGSRARDELIERGWSVNGNNIGGDCGAVYEFPCMDTLNIGVDTLYGNLILPAIDQVNLEGVVIDSFTIISVKAPNVNLNAELEITQSAEVEVLQEGCSN